MDQSINVTTLTLIKFSMTSRRFITTGQAFGQPGLVILLVRAIFDNKEART